MFDFESFNAELKQNTDQTAVIDSLFDDNDRLRDRMNARRELMNQQVRSDAIKSKLCDKIQTEKRAVPGLDKKIRLLEDTDPELFRYIRKLEFIQDGIWCNKCNVPKKIGSKPAQGIEPIEDAIARRHEEAERFAKMEKMELLSSEFKTLEKDIKNAAGLLLELVGKHQQQTKEMDETLHAIENKLVNIHQQYDSMTGVSKSAIVEPRTQNPNQPPETGTGYYRGSRVFKSAAPTYAPKPTKKPLVRAEPAKASVVIDVKSIASTVKKEDLPQRPIFDLDALLEEKFSNLSSDDLLN